MSMVYEPIKYQISGIFDFQCFTANPTARCPVGDMISPLNTFSCVHFNVIFN